MNPKETEIPHKKIAGRPPEVQREKPNDVIPSHRQIIEDARAFLRPPTLPTEIDLREIERGKNAEYFLAAAGVIEHFHRQGIDLATVQLPKTWQQLKENYQKNQYSHESFVFWIYLKIKQFLEREPYIAECDEETTAYFFERVYQAYARRLNFFREVQKEVTTDGLTAEHQKERRQQVREWLKVNAEQAVETHIPEVLQQFSEPVRHHVVRNISTIELNTGCSVGCAFCAYSADRKVAKSLPFSEAAWLATHVPYVFTFYSATDPLDYVVSDDPTKSYADIVTLYTSATGKPVFTSTAYPQGAKTRMQKLSQHISRISLSYMNTARLKRDGMLTDHNGLLLPNNPDAEDSLYFGGMDSVIQDYHHLEAGVGWKRLPLNAYRAFGLTMIAADIKEPPAFIAGHQRTLQKKQGKTLPAYSGSIHCTDSLLFTPERMRNSAPMLSSNAFPDGRMLADIHEHQLRNGNETLGEIAARVQVKRLPDTIKESRGGFHTKEITIHLAPSSEPKILLSDVLPYGLLQYAFGNAALKFTRQTDIDMPRTLVEIQGSTTIETTYPKRWVPHTITLLALNTQGEIGGKWKITYNLTDGEILEMKRGLPG